jgi:hypothetical protein
MYIFVPWYLKFIKDEKINFIIYGDGADRCIQYYQCAE